MANKNIVITINEISYTMDSALANAIIAMAKGNGKIVEPAQPKAEAEATTKAKTTKSTKSTGWTTEQRKAYEDTAKELGCYGKHGVWKCCRQYVYDVLDGKMTKANAKKAVNKVKKDNGWA